MKKIIVRLVTTFLTPFDRARRVQYCQENLDFIEGKKNFFSTLITGNETWCYYYDPYIIFKSKQMEAKGVLSAREGKVQKVSR
jgi:hypothetical protein